MLGLQRLALSGNFGCCLGGLWGWVVGGIWAGLGHGNQNNLKLSIWPLTSATGTAHIPPGRPSVRGPDSGAGLVERPGRLGASKGLRRNGLSIGVFVGMLNWGGVVRGGECGHSLGAD